MINRNSKTFTPKKLLMDDRSDRNDQAGLMRELKIAIFNH